MGQFDEQQLSQLVKKAQAGDQVALQDLIAWAMDYLFSAVLSMLHERRQKGTYITETLHDGGPDLLERLRDDAWAVTHSACCRMTLRLDSFRGRNALGRETKFGTWVYAIARNEMRTLLRNRWRERKRYGGARDEFDGVEQLCGLSLAAPTPVRRDGHDGEGSYDRASGFGARAPVHPGRSRGYPAVSGAEVSPESAVLARLDNELVRKALREAPLTPEQREAVVLFHGYGYRHEQIAAMTGVQVGTVKKRVFDGLRKLRLYVQQQSAG